MKADRVKILRDLSHLPIIQLMRLILMNQRKASRLPGPRYQKRELNKVRANRICLIIVKFI